MPEINLRAGQQPPSKRFNADELAKTEYRLRQFLEGQKTAGQNAEWKRFEQDQIRKAKILGDWRLQQEKMQYQDALRMDKQWDAQKRRTRQEADLDNRRRDQQIEQGERRARQSMYSDALRDDRLWEREKTRSARDMFSDAQRDNRQFDQEKKRIERDRIAAERKAAREAAANAPMGFVKGAAIGGGASAVLGAIMGGAPPTRIMGTAAGSAAGGVAGALGMAEGGVGMAGLLADAVVHLLFSPNSIVNAITRPWQNYRTAAMDLSRASLNPGEGMYDQFFSGTAGGVDKRLGAFGMGPMDAIKILSSLGVVPVTASPSASMDLATTIKGYSMSSAFVGMQPGTVEGLLGQGMAQGNASQMGYGAGGYINQFGRIMEEATMRGMDRAKVLDSMQTSLETIAKAGSLGSSPEAVQDMVYRFMNSGLMGGRSGEAAAAAIGGIEGTMADITGNKLSSAMLMTQLPQYGNLKTEAGIQAFVGDRAWQASGNTPEKLAGRSRLVSLITRAASDGRYAAAMQYSMQLMAADPGRLPQLLGPSVSQASGGNPSLDPIIMGQATGTGLTGGLGLTTPNPWPPGTGISAGQVLGLKGRAGMTGNMMAYDPMVSDQEYKSRLLAAGIKPDAADAIIRGARASNMNPFMMAAIGNAESGNNPNQGWNDPRAGGGKLVSYGPMQVNQYAHPGLPGGNLTGAAGYMAGGNVFMDALKANHGNIEGALLSYRGTQDPAWMQKVTGMYSQLQGTADGGGFPTQVMQSQANEQYQSIQTASMFQGAVTAANSLADSFRSLQESVRSLGATLNKINSAGGSSRPAPFATHSGAMP